jgi:hypothetical protein
MNVATFCNEINLSRFYHLLEAFQLKYGFHNKSFIINAPLVSCLIPLGGFAAAPAKSR